MANAGYPGTNPSLFFPTGVGGPIIHYYALYDRYYSEQWLQEANEIRIGLCVEWDKRNEFHKFAVGGTAPVPASPTYLTRYTPLQCPFNPRLYLSHLRLRDKGLANNGGTLTQLAGNAWFDLPNGWCVYDATFTNRAYSILTQDEAGIGSAVLSTNWNTNPNRLISPVVSGELQRYVIRETESRPKERKSPSYGFVTDDAAATPIPEVGFIPFYEYERTYTWLQVPWQLVPWGAMEKCFLKLNNSYFDGQFPGGNILFKGTAGKIRPYVGADSSWYTDLVYVFGEQPADGVGNGWNKLPRANGTWVKIRAAGTGGATGIPSKPLYLSEDLDALFKPDPKVTLLGSPSPTSTTYKATQDVTVRVKVNPYLMMAPYVVTWTNATPTSDTSIATASLATTTIISVSVRDVQNFVATASITYTIV